MLTAFEDAAVSCSSFRALDQQPVMGGIVPGSDNIGDIQTFDAGYDEFYIRISN